MTKFSRLGFTLSRPLLAYHNTLFAGTLRLPWYTVLYCPPQGLNTMNYERFIAVGNATRNAELRTAKDGVNAFTTFTLAVNKAQDRANFYSVVIFGATAEAAAKAIKKGDAVLVEGTLNLRPYTTKLKQQRLDVQVQAEQWVKLASPRQVSPTR